MLLEPPGSGRDGARVPAKHEPGIRWRTPKRMIFSVSAYTPDKLSEWDAVVQASRNGTFLHLRAYMDYHATRFHDESLIVYDENASPVAVFPANRGDAATVVSHGGLTYGGLIFLPRIRQKECIELVRLISEFYRGRGAGKILYKAIPRIFHSTFSEEDLYGLWVNGASLVRRDVSTVVDLRRELRFTKGRKWSVNRAVKSGIAVRRATSLEGFHRLLTEVLSRHGATPTHSKDELALLMNRFPEKIQLFEAVLADRLLAGALIFDFGRTVHSQYLANSDEGREAGALDYLLADLMKNHFVDKEFFSFGISTEAGGRVLNEGLIAQKEAFGGYSVCHDFYELNL